MAKKFYVLDTSVYLTDYRAIYSYGTNDIIVPLTVLEELDNCKKRPNGVGVNARGIIRIFDELREVFKRAGYDGIKYRNTYEPSFEAARKAGIIAVE